MKKLVFTLTITLLFTACVPLKIAPQIPDYKIAKGKRFHKQLPKQELFIFNDPKDEDEFFKFLSAKYGAETLETEYYIPFELNGTKYFLSYYQVARNSKTLNFAPILIDAARNAKKKRRTNLKEFYTTNRDDIWYICISITSEQSADCLNVLYNRQPELVQYLKNLKTEYITTHNYEQTKFNNQNINHITP
jgi:hypothetical protein